MMIVIYGVGIACTLFVFLVLYFNKDVITKIFNSLLGMVQNILSALEDNNNDDFL